MSTYTINIKRGAAKGTVSFNSGNVSVSTDCWWDPDVKVDAGTYSGYATRMANKNDGTDGKKREAIWFGTGVPYNNGTGTSGAIFIHKGTSPSHSDGCIVCARNKVYEIWTAINPKEIQNVSIVVSDE